MLLLIAVAVVLLVVFRLRVQDRAQPASATTLVTTNIEPGAPRPAARTAATTNPVPTGQVTNAAALDAPIPLDWTERVEAVRAIEESDAEKSVRLLALFPTLPPDGQDEIAPELAALTPDSNYSALTGILTDIHTPEPVLDVLLTELLDRPERVQLPLLLDVAKTPDHPRANDAIEMLASALGENLGTDWAAWTKKISERLAGRPE